METPPRTSQSPTNHPLGSKQPGNEEKKSAAEAEVKRMSQLPPTSAYAAHRLRVLNKVLHLLSLQRTVSEDQELELLFAGLHL